MRGEGIVATTHLLPNGHQFSADDLRKLAAELKARLLHNPFLYDDHRTTIPPIARILTTWVAAFPGSADDTALFISFETLEGATDERVLKKLQEGGLSLGFWGRGYGGGPECDEGSDAILAGISPTLATDAQLRSMVDALADEFPDIPLGVRHYHQHAADPESTLVLALTVWLLAKVGDKVFDRVWDTLFGKGNTERKLPATVKIVVETENGSSLHIEAPVSLGEDRLKLAISEGLVYRETLGEASLETRTQIAVSYDNAGMQTVERRPLHLLDRAENPPSASD